MTLMLTDVADVLEIAAAVPESGCGGTDWLRSRASQSVLSGAPTLSTQPAQRIATKLPPSAPGRIFNIRIPFTEGTHDQPPRRVQITTTPQRACSFRNSAGTLESPR